MSETGEITEKAFDAVVQAIEKEHENVKAAVQDKVGRAKETAASALK
jgi:hypothetical protein